MKCPDRDALARLLDGEDVEEKGELLAHIQKCGRCKRIFDEDSEIGLLLRELFKRCRQDLVREAIPCPGVEELAAYAEGKVPVYRRNRMLQHFCTCPGCARAVLDISGTFEKRFSPPPADILREARAIYSKGRENTETGP